MIASAAPALRVERVTKRYGQRVALQDVSFDLEVGTLVALLGPNGAGKSTLFQVLTGLFSADAGDVTVDGHSMRRTPIRALRGLGVVFQQPSLDLDLTVAQNLRFHADLHGLPRTLAANRAREACEAVGLGADLDRLARELSGGNRRKVELVRALLHRPHLLLMDEPSAGLDPKSRRDLFTTLRDDVSRRGSTVLWATHLVEEAVAADRVLVLHHGRVVADGTPDAVTQALGGITLEAGFLRATAGGPPSDRELRGDR